jgi:K+-sensing histidine kinase KdpD
MEHLSRIFEPFFTTKPPGGGSGIGLTTAYAFVKSSDGHIEVSSEVGRGTTFRLHFPKADEAVHTEPRRATQGQPLRANGSHRRVGRFDPGSSTG